MESNKKIGIVSVDINTPMFNYGAVLHTWAFEQYLSKHNFTNFEVLNYYPESIEYQNRILPFWDFFTDCHPRLSLNYCLHYFKYFRKYKAIRRFVKKELIVSKKKYRYSSIARQKLPYDVLIAEDDVIWAPGFLCRKELVDKTFYLAHENMECCKKIAYAPSMAECNFKNEEFEIIRSYLSSFDFVSVREQYQKEFVINRLNINCEKVLDAVFLLDESDYSRIISERFKGKKFILVYLPADDNIELRKSALSYSKEHNLPIIELTNKIWDRGNAISTCGVEDFLSGIKYSTCVFTNSFHAVCFSIIFQKEFYAFSRQNAGKVKDICSLFDLSERFNEGDNISLDLKTIDYKGSVNNLRKKLSDESKTWLLSAMKEVLFK
ncbi:MAG: polysaccharide pyruvyl transferase family protein [Bacilli bacterium]|jgi:uncharacterized protein YacL (UPF0231 family)|nr:polysaccharide pyruvyl transferase family protein [Bacilli bacterium]